MAHRPDYESADYKEGYEDGKREASKQWVWLSDEEISDCVKTGIAKWKKESIEIYYSDIDFFIYREFEAKLKEKNG